MDWNGSDWITGLEEIELDGMRCEKHNTIEHDYGIVALLFLEGIQNAINQLLLQTVVDARSAKICNHVLDCLHGHLADPSKQP